MAKVFVDPAFNDAERRRRLYLGDVILYTRVAAVADFARFTRGLVEGALGADPPSVHARRSNDDLAELLVDFKPRFIHHPESMLHVQAIVTELGGKAENIHADVPKLRTAFPEGGLSTGIAYAFQAHRDTWYGAPRQQINWWMPVWPVADDNIMEFYPRGFDAVVENTSDRYNYYLANAWRGRIKDFSGRKDTRVHPAPAEPVSGDEPRLCLVPPVGGIMLFSGDQLHATVPNTSPATRYSIDFRTVDALDVVAGVGAPARDVQCRGTSLRDFRRLSDGAVFADDEIAPYDDETARSEGITVYEPA